MKAYVIELACPDCDGDLIEVNQTIDAAHAVGITNCAACGREFILSISLRNRQADGLAQVGTRPPRTINGQRIYA